jgi:hypothetical protein
MKRLVRPHVATVGYRLGSYGMQEVRGSNPRSSTGQRPYRGSAEKPGSQARKYMPKVPVSCLIVAVLAGVLLASGCSSAPPGPRDAFAVETDLTDSVPTNVDEIQDVGLPGLDNVTGQSVRLRSVRLVSTSSAMRQLSVNAYSMNRVGYGGIQAQAGNLPVECPGQFVPAPVSAFSTGPHAQADWFVVISLLITQPGTYHLDEAKITYTSGGTTGWQYMYLGVTFIVRNPPKPGPRPLPPSSVCGKP